MTVLAYLQSVQTSFNTLLTNNSLTGDVLFESPNAGYSFEYDATRARFRVLKNNKYYGVIVVIPNAMNMTAFPTPDVAAQRIANQIRNNASPAGLGPYPIFYPMFAGGDANMDPNPVINS